MIAGRGYVRGNIAVISRRANVIKNSASAKELLIIGMWLAGVTAFDPKEVPVIKALCGMK